MRKAGIVAIMSVAAIAAVLCVIPASFVSAASVNVYFPFNPDIEVSFSDGGQIDGEGKLTVTATSGYYNMHESGMLFHVRDGNGKPTAETVSPLTHTEIKDEYTVVRTFWFTGVTADLELSFINLHPLAPQEPGGENTAPAGTRAGADEGSVTMMMSAVAALAVCMLATMFLTSRNIDSVSKSAEGVK